MKSLFRLTFVAVVFSTVHFAQAEPAPLADTCTFFGRWDLRDSERAITVNTGSYVNVHFDGPTLQARFDISTNGAQRPTIAWKIDDGDWKEDEIWPVVVLAENLPPGPHVATLMVRGLDEHFNRWVPPIESSLTFLGFDVPNGKILPALDEWVHPKLKVEFLGDSITEGVLVYGPNGMRGNAVWQTNALRSWPRLTGTNLGAVWRQVGFGATDIDHGGSGGGPAGLEGFNWFYSGCPRDDWQPDLVVINYGTNGAKADSDYYSATYSKYLALVREGYPKAKIAAVRPFGGFQEVAIKKAVEAAQAAGDKNIFYIDTTGWYDGNLHPSWEASPGIAEHMANALKTQVLDWPADPK